MYFVGIWAKDHKIGELAQEPESRVFAKKAGVLLVRQIRLRNGAYHDASLPEGL
jgi:hypothetical protein